MVLGISRIRRQEPVHGGAEFVNAVGFVVRELNPGGLVKIKGEIWQAFVKDGHTIHEGEKVKVVERRGLTLIVSEFFEQ